MKKCHNCKNGIVDGGANKRIKKELEQLYNKKRNEINLITEKDNEIKKIKIKEINDKFELLITEKNKEIPMKISNCLYCKGKGDYFEINKFWAYKN